MSDKVKRDGWRTFFDEFSKRNHARPTRIEVFGEMGAQEAEHHLPLNGIVVDESGTSAPRIEILLGDGSPDAASHLAHVITQATAVFLKAGTDGRDEALEIEDADGAKTLLRFEPSSQLQS